jgi:small subunit ribosomal protein S6e
MRQGALTHGQVLLLLGRGIPVTHQGGLDRERKSAQGCIVDANLSVLSLVTVKQGDLKTFLD